jgi:hypothetical protein
MVTSEWILQKLGVDWIHMGHDRDKWWVFASMIMNFWVPKRLENP